HFCPDLEPASAQSWPTSVQRGIPRMSCWQTKGFLLTFLAQQLFSALHVMLASLHTAFVGLQALPLSHRPTGSVELALLQLPTPLTSCTPPKPQQAESLRQPSSVGRQPLGGWHTVTPVL